MIFAFKYHWSGVSIGIYLTYLFLNELYLLHRSGEPTREVVTDLQGYHVTIGTNPGRYRYGKCLYSKLILQTLCRYRNVVLPSIPVRTVKSRPTPIFPKQSNNELSQSKPNFHLNDLAQVRKNPKKSLIYTHYINLKSFFNYSVRKFQLKWFQYTWLKEDLMNKRR